MCITIKSAFSGMDQITYFKLYGDFRIPELLDKLLECMEESRCMNGDQTDDDKIFVSPELYGVITGHLLYYETLKGEVVIDYYLRSGNYYIVRSIG